MEKKVLLQDLVETGRNIRKQIISKVVCCDRGVHPIGEIWDANKTINTIVAGATEAQDTLKEVEDKLNGEINRAKAAENNLDTIKTGRINADSITQLTDEQIDSLKAGDTVIKGAGDKKHAYVVAYKKDDEMSLVYADHENIEEVYYEKQGGTWTYVQTDNFALQFKTISNQSILGEGNIDIQSTVMANEPFPSSWRTNGTMEQLISDINADTSVVPGKIYLKTVTISDLPAGMQQAEMKVEIMGQQSGEFIMVFSVSSATTAPYKWEYSAYNEHHGPWRSWLPSSTTIPTVPTNVSAFNNDAGYLTSHQDLTSIIGRIEALELAAGITPPQEEEPQEEEPVE